METLQNKTLIIHIEPALGGKIAQITHRRTGRMWLAKHPRLAWRPLPRAEWRAPDAYVRLGDLGGWDECCPTVGYSCYPRPPFEGVALPDHGECWFQSPPQQRQANVIEHIWRGQALPFELRRRLELDAERPRLVLAYTLRTLAQSPLSLLWSAHPLFAVEEGMTLEIPNGTWFTIASDGSPLGLKGMRFEWPRCGAWDLARITPRAGWAVKLFSDVFDAGRAALVAPTGERFTLTWSSASPGLRLGLWLNYNGWSGDGGSPLQNIGIEPCLGMPDALAEAMAANTALTLAPGAQCDWQIQVDVSDG